MTLLSCGCEVALAAAPVPDAGDVDAARPHAIATPTEACQACLFDNRCLVGGDGGPGTGETDVTRILLDPIAAARGRWQSWRGPPPAGRLEGIGRVRADLPALSPTGLGRMEVQRVVKRHLRELTYCYEQELPEHPGLRGRVQVHYTILLGGGIATGSLQSTLIEDAGVRYCGGSGEVIIPPRDKGELADCVASMMKGWSFPPPNGAPAVAVTQSFDFAPRARRGATEAAAVSPSRKRARPGASP